eukprot:2758867-Rhodomonas_salina.1
MGWVTVCGNLKRVACGRLRLWREPEGAAFMLRPNPCTGTQLVHTSSWNLKWSASMDRRTGILCDASCDRHVTAPSYEGSC